jgi:uncharacterized protein
MQLDGGRAVKELRRTGRGFRYLAGAAALASAGACVAAPAVDTADASPACAAPHLTIGSVQGTGTASPMIGATVTVRGVVVGDFEGAAPALGGFYIQDERDDGDPLTSAGVFVANGQRNDVSTGMLVVVTGRVSEERGQTQVAAEAIAACGSGAVAPVDVLLPLASADYLERYEGMLVRLPQTLYVTGTYQLGRYGEVVLSSGGRLPQPTQVAAPGAAALAVQQANDRNRILLDDGILEENPGVIVFARGGAPLSARNTLRGGDAVRGVVGVLTQTSATASSSGSQYRVRPVGALGGRIPEFTPVNQRTARAPDVGGTVRIASFNVLNYFNTFDGCTLGVGDAAVDCRGASSPQEFERQWRKTVAAVLGLAADVIGVVEVENDGYGPRSAIAHLAERLNAATAPGTYAFIDVDAATGTVNALGTDAIKVAFLYRPARVRPVGRTAVLNSTRFVNGGESAPRNRPSLAQAFAGPEGGRVVVSINHLKSKGSGCDVPDAGDGQGACNAARTVAAQELQRWLAEDPTGIGEGAVLIVGDLNAYAREDPIATLARSGYTDLLHAHVGATAYTYVFNGQWGVLDHALASPALLPRITGAAAWHINADEPPVLDFGTASRSAAQQRSLYAPGPFRSSDHDPVVVGVRL